MAKLFWIWLYTITTLLILSVFMLMQGCMTVATPIETDNCATVYKTAYNDGYQAGYQKATNLCPAQPDIALKLFRDKAEVMSFLKWSQADRCGGTDDCLDRADMLLKEARDKGYDAYGVVINFVEGGSHALVCFPLKDGTMLYIEPRLDKVVDISIGINYKTQIGQSGYPVTIEKIGIFR